MDDALESELSFVIHGSVEVELDAWWKWLALVFALACITIGHSTHVHTFCHHAIHHTVFVHSFHLGFSLVALFLVFWSDSSAATNHLIISSWLLLLSLPAFFLVFWSNTSAATNHLIVSSWFHVTIGC